MKQNNIKELILSMRKSKHNMFKKVEALTLAIQDKGSVSMDTHELSNLVKDTFTKRRAKIFYADVFSSVIGEPNGVGEAPVFMAMSMLDAENYALTQWKLGDALNYTAVNDLPLSMEPYMIFLTQEQYSKFSVSTDTSMDVMEEVVAMPIEEIFGSPEDMSNALNLHVDASFFEQYPYTSSFPYIVIMGKNDFESNSEEWQEHYDEFMRMHTVSLIYDGVKYTYKPDGTIEISKISNTTPVAKEAPTFVTMAYNIDSNEMLASTYKLGDPITIQNGTMNPYIIFLTEELKNKISISVVDAGDLSNENINAMYGIVNIANEGSISGDLDGYVDTNVYKYMIYGSYLPFLGNPGAEYAANKVTITYDGVDYVYLS